MLSPETMTLSICSASPVRSYKRHFIEPSGVMMSEPCRRGARLPSQPENSDAIVSRSLSSSITENSSEPEGWL